MKKRLLFVCFLSAFCALFLSQVAVAAPNVAEKTSAPSSISEPFLYGELNSGWTSRNLNAHMSQNFADSAVDDQKHGREGFSFGTALGYQFNETFGLEGGYWYLPYASGYAAGEKVEQETWLAYLAGKATIPLAKSLSLFGKFGPVFVHSNSSNVYKSGTVLLVSQGARATSKYWDVLYGLGLQYTLDKNWEAHCQFMRAPGYDHANSTNYSQPKTTIYSVGIAYKLFL